MPTHEDLYNSLKESHVELRNRFHVRERGLVQELRVLRVMYNELLDRSEGQRAELRKINKAREGEANSSKQPTLRFKNKDGFSAIVADPALIQLFEREPRDPCLYCLKNHLDYACDEQIAYHKQRTRSASKQLRPFHMERPFC